MDTCCAKEIGELIPALKPGVRLREEPEGAVLISDGDDHTYDPRYLLISPFEAFIVALCNGSRSIREIAQTLLALKDSPEQDKVQEDLWSLMRSFADYIQTASAPHVESGPRLDPLRFLVKPDLGTVPKRPHAPLWVDLYVTRRCNFRCTYCFADAKYARMRSDREDDNSRRIRLFSLVDQIIQLEIKQVLITGGEPTLVPYLPDIIGQFTQYGVRVHLATNASLINDKMSEKLKGVGLQDVQAKLDARDPAIHDMVSGVRGSYTKLINGIRVLKSHSFRVCVASVVTALNIRDIPEVVHVCADLGVDEVSPRLYQAGIWALEGRGGDALNPSSESLIWLQKKIEELQDQYQGVMKVSTIDSALFCKKPENRVPSCSGMVSSCTVLDNGLVVPCEVLADFSDDFVMGDTNKDTITDIWNSQRAEDWILRKRPVIEGPCSSCEMFARCKGGCPWKSYIAYGSWLADPSCVRAPVPTLISLPSIN